uniref:Uncharacterized protein n=1 Tax=Octopus bimaculoides TaxID=37653 RepID=A0A0L8GJZ0_OCTBM
MPTHRINRSVEKCFTIFILTLTFCIQILPRPTLHFSLLGLIKGSSNQGLVPSVSIYPVSSKLLTCV